MAWIQFASPAIVGNDAYYHIRWSRMLRDSLPHLPAFKWLPLTVLRPQLFVDQHFLFHVSLMPFTYGDLRLGAKLAAPTPNPRSRVPNRACTGRNNSRPVFHPSVVRKNRDKERSVLKTALLASPCRATSPKMRRCSW